MFSIEIPDTPPPAAEVRPAGDRRQVGWDAASLLRGGARWMPVMGELHYARVPAERWRDSLLKMRAGGISVVATYVFWIHHEEAEGRPDWEGDRNLGAFVRAARDAGLEVVVRLGPWCHGEVRNGGLPDWVVERFGERARTDDASYLGAVRKHFLRIAEQLRGALWKDGGPVVAFQIENEYGGPAGHLVTLKRMAVECGLEAPLYTRTGWPDLATPMPFGELLPLYGAYAEGFWDRALTQMPGFYPAGFRFSSLRTDAAIATDLLGEREARDPEDTERYPFLTCELGGGMMSSYHRRLRIDPRDIEAVALVKIGSGGNLPGYYMYHGGVNPEGRTTLNETQASRYWNDLPVRNYDFQAPIGAAGQVRPHHHLLRRMHLFVGDFGEALASMRACFPERRPENREDVHTLRWSVRSRGDSGFLFINNYERLRHLPPKTGVRFEIGLPGGRTVSLPSQPVVFPADTATFWPFGIEIAEGVRIDHATARLLCRFEGEDALTIFLGATAGVPVELAVNGSAPRRIQPGRGVAMSVERPGGGEVRLVVLDEPDSRALWKLDGRAFLTRASLRLDGRTLRMESEDPSELALMVCARGGGSGERDGVFRILREGDRPEAAVPATLYPIRGYGAPRNVRMGWTEPAVAVAPGDADFEAAARWRIALPESWNPETHPLLRIFHVGDVARVRIGGSLAIDDFFNGAPLDVDLARHAAALRSGADIEVEVLPLEPDAPILLPEGTRPVERAGRIERVELVRLHRSELMLPED